MERISGLVFKLLGSALRSQVSDPLKYPKFCVRIRTVRSTMARVRVSNLTVLILTQVSRYFRGSGPKWQSIVSRNTNTEEERTGPRSSKQALSCLEICSLYYNLKKVVQDREERERERKSASTFKQCQLEIDERRKNPRLRFHLLS